MDFIAIPGVGVVQEGEDGALRFCPLGEPESACVPVTKFGG
jgi:hypothetical protein